VTDSKVGVISPRHILHRGENLISSLAAFAEAVILEVERDLGESVTVVRVEQTR
jgi:hypothetical protein